MDLEKRILQVLKFNLNNSTMKLDDLQEWSTSKDIVKKNLQPDKEVLVEVTSMGVYCAVLKSADKRASA